MPVEALLKEEITLPDGVTAAFADNVLTLKGPKGSIARQFIAAVIRLDVAGNAITLRAELPKRKDKALFGTFVAHVRNMVVGVTDGFEYKMKAVYSHFPIKMKVAGNALVIENFLGERVPRNADIVGETKVVINGEELVLSGVSIEEVGQSAANIERATRIRRYDPRVFQDGVYIVEKHGKPMSRR